MATAEKSVVLPAVTAKNASAGLPIQLAGKLFKRSIAILLLAAVWEVVPRTGAVEVAFLPPLSEVLQAWWNLLVSGELWNHFEASIIRSLSGFGIALVIAIPLGLLIGWYRGLSELLTPVLELFRNTAALALLPVFTLILGIGETSKITLIVFACSWPILLNTISGVKNVDPLLIKSAKSMGLNSFKLFTKVILPASVPTIFTGVRLAGAGSILVLIAAEMVGAKAGLGYLINYAQFNFQTPEMYAGILTISLIGLLFNHGLVALERKFTAWKPNHNES
ncbi:NitT/TauT family transport system permease protein [Paenibacillus phyllosphaerae]|uniref:NitT/TauT family transport system permease protein n=1 Tax=Paenibacillus phyllosphaerae TaxID=274593 RepID=A0A7W5AZD2_9BACL|nr:ABC transporter permease [Paenibacillus phyllosphaerae]MBB3111573.1 NitT/TauT family transport system permease protein [Paenibacillus phyllosphaerae]